MRRFLDSGCDGGHSLQGYTAIASNPTFVGILGGFVRRITSILLAASLLAVAAPGLRAQGAVLSGRVLTGAGPNGPDCVDAACIAFFAAGCPADMAHDDGATESIVDVSGHAGERLTFSWTDETTRRWDQGLPVLRAVLTFYVRTSCTQPSEFSEMFGLGTEPEARSFTYRLPDDAKWLVVVPQDGSALATWDAA